MTLPGPAVPAEGLAAPRRQLATAAVLSAVVLVVLDGAIANLALPTLAHALGTSPADAVWVVTAYQLALVMFLLPAAALGQRLGHRRVYAAGVGLFTLASLGCALSPTLGWLVAARFGQGLGSTAVMALGVAQLRAIHPPSRLGLAIGWNALTVALASAAGPSVGAAILAVAHWPWLFAVNLPLGLVVLRLTRHLPESPRSPHPVDVPAIALNALAFGLLVVGIDLVGRRPEAGAGLLLGAGVAFVALVRRELPSPAPVVPLDLLRNGSFRLAVLASMCCFAAQMAGLVALPFYLQRGLGLGTAATGLLMTPWPLATAVAAPLAGRLCDRLPTGALCAAGGLVFALGLGLAASWPLQGGVMALVPFAVLCGLGFGFFQTPNNRHLQLVAPRERSGAAGGMQGAARLLGQTAGAVLMSLLFSLAPAGLAPRLGLALAALLALAAGAVSLARAGAGVGAGAGSGGPRQRTGT